MYILTESILFYFLFLKVLLAIFKKGLNVYVAVRPPLNLNR